MRKTLPYDRFYRKRRERLSNFFSQGAVLVLYGLLPLLIVVGTCYILFFSSFFVIERIELETPEGIDKSAVRSDLFEYMNTHKTAWWGHTNLFFFDKKKAKDALSLHFIITNISFSKRIPRTLFVKFDGYPFQAYVLRGANLFELASDGMVGSQHDPSLLGSIPYTIRETIFHMSSQDDSEYRKGKKRYPLIIIDTRPQTDQLTKEFLDRTSLRAIDAFFASLAEQKLYPSHVIFSRKEEGVRISLLEGWDVLVSVSDDKDAQMNNLIQTLSQKVKKNRKKLTSVDLRFGNKVYYSFK